MATLFEIGLANAIVATLLGAVIFILGRWRRHPVVIHALWVVVLVKLITPPIISLPLPGLSLPTAKAPTNSSQSSAEMPSQRSVQIKDAQNSRLLPSAEERPGLEPEVLFTQTPFDKNNENLNPGTMALGNSVTVEDWTEASAGPLEPTTSEADPLASLNSSEIDQSTDLAGLALPWILPGLVGVWGLGTCGVIALVLLRIRRFQRLLTKLAEHPPADLCREVNVLARSVGLTRAPRLVLVPGNVSPLVWTLSRQSIIIFPKGLLTHLDAEGRRSLLLHELTHLCRCHHWVRGLELVVGCLYWWLPLVWLARRELQQAEEECCDAWVVWWMHGERQPYARALIQTLDFLAGALPKLPPVASGLGQVAFLHQRLKGILNADVPRSLGWRGTMVAVLCSLLILPVVPTWGQTDPVEETEPPKAVATISKESNETREPSTAARIAKLFGSEAGPIMESIDFQSQPQSFPSSVENAQCSAFSNDGRRLITVYGRMNESGEVRIWDVTNQTEQAKWTEPRGIRAVTMAPDGRTFAYGTYGGVVKLGDIESGKVQPAWEQTTVGVESLAFSTDGRWLATGSTDGLIHVWEVATGKITQTLRGHSGQVYGLGILPEGNMIVSCGADKTLKFWDRENGKVLHSLDHPDQMFSLSVAPDGKLVATGCQDGNVRLWEAATGKLQTTLAPQRGGVSLAFNSAGDTLAASAGNSFTVWNLKTGEASASVNARQGNVHHVTLSPDGKTLATTSWDRTVKIWNVETRVEVAHLVPENPPNDEAYPVMTVAWSPDDSLVASAHDDKTVRLRDGATGEVRAVLEGHEDVVSDLKFSPDGKILVTAGLDHTLKLWHIDPLAKEPFQTLSGHTNWVMCVSFSPDGTKLASGGYDRTIRVWDVQTGKELQKLEGHTAAVRSVAFLSKDRLASASSDHTVKVWEIDRARELATLKKHTAAVRALAYASQSQLLASASEDKTINLWDLSKLHSGESPNKAVVPDPRSLSGHAGMIWCLAFSPGETVLAGGDLKGEIILWNPASGKQRSKVKRHQDIVSTLAFASNGRFLLSGSYDRRLLLWRGEAPVQTLAEIATIAKVEDRVRMAIVSPDGRWLALSGGKKETELRELSQLNAPPIHIEQGQSTSHLAFSPDSRLIAIGTYTGEIRLWDIETRKWRPNLIGHEGQVQRVTFSPDGKKLASAGWDHVIKLWDLPEHKLIATSPKQPLLISDVAFSPDGQQLATCSGNWKEWRTPGEIKLWSANPLQEIKVLGGHKQEIRGVVFTPDGERLVSYSSSSAGTTRVWDLKNGKELGRFAGCSALTMLPGGQQAVTGDLYGKMGLWDLKTFKLVRNFTGHKDLIYTLSNSPDGSLLVSVCRDGKVTLWPTDRL